MHMIRKTFFVPALGCILLTAMLLGCGNATNTGVSNETPAVNSDTGSTGDQTVASSTETPKDSNKIGYYSIIDLDVVPDVNSWHHNYILYTSEDGLYGVISKNGEVITEPKYTKVFDAWNPDFNYDADYSEIYGVIEGESVEKINPIDKTITVLDYDNVRGVTGSEFANGAYLFVNEKEGRWDLYESIGEMRTVTYQLGDGSSSTGDEYGAFTDSNGLTYDGLTLIASSEKVHDDLIALGYSEELASSYPVKYKRNSTLQEFSGYFCFNMGNHIEEEGGYEATDWLFCKNTEEGLETVEITLQSELWSGEGFCVDASNPFSNVYLAAGPVFVTGLFTNSTGRSSSKWEFAENPVFENLNSKKGTVAVTYLSTFYETVFMGELLGRDHSTLFVPIAYLGNGLYLGWEQEDLDGDGIHEGEGSDYIVAGVNKTVYQAIAEREPYYVSFLQKATDKRGNLTCAWNNFFALANGSGDRYTLYNIYESEIKKINETPYTSIDIGDFYARVGYEDGTYGYVELSAYKEAEQAERSGRYKFASIPASGMRALVSEDGESFYFINLSDGMFEDPTDETIEGVDAYELADDVYCVKKADGSYQLLYR